MPDVNPIQQRIQSLRPEPQEPSFPPIAAQADTEPAEIDEPVIEEAVADETGLPEPEEAPEQQAEGEDDASFLQREVELPSGEKATVQDLIQGQMRADHHTQAVQAHVDAQHQFEAMSGMLQQFEQAGWAMIAPDLQQFENVNMEQLAISSPDQYSRIKPHYDALMKRAGEFQQRMNQLHQAMGQQAHQAYDQAWKQVTQDLSYSIPGYSNETLPKLNEYALKAGFRQEELATFSDSRIWKLIHKAKAYDDLKRGKKKNAPRMPGIKGTRAAIAAQTDSAQVQRLKAASQRGDQNATRELLRSKIRSKLTLR